MTGTWINIAAIVVGSSLGLLFGLRLPERFRKIVFQGIALFTIFLGIKMALRSEDPLIMILSIVMGGLLGEWWQLEKHLESFAEKIRKLSGSRNEKFSEGLLTAFLLFCMGSLTILGALEEGLGGSADLLITKSIMDGFSSVILAAGLGVGVLFSIIPLFLYQGGLTMLSSSIEPYLSNAMIEEMTAVGGLMLIGLGLSILEIKKIKLINYLPALIMALLLSWFFTKFALLG